MAKLTDYYKVLGVRPFSNEDELRAAYRQLARKFHPDLNPGDKQAEERFKAINAAYDILGNAQKKVQYDRGFRFSKSYQASQKAATEAKSGKTKKKKPKAEEDEKGKQGKKGKSSQQQKTMKETVKTDAAAKKETVADTPITELFDHFLKKGFGAGASRTEKASDKTTSASQKKPKVKPVSPKGDNTRVRRGDDVVVEVLISPQEAEEGTVKLVNVEHQEFCRSCTGTGKVNGRVCRTCHGEKLATRVQKMDVRIPGGVRNGSKVRVAGEGGWGVNGGESGDLFLKVAVAVDASLRIDGLDVHCAFSVSLPQAVLGANVQVPTLGGAVTMTVPAGTVSGKVLRLKGQGAKKDGDSGDQFVTVVLDVPKRLSGEERRHYEALLTLFEKRSG